jgi:hypothetical protein
VLWKSGIVVGFCGRFGGSESCGDFWVYVWTFWMTKRVVFGLVLWWGRGVFGVKIGVFFWIKIEQLCGKWFGRKW